jgi:hypothetical protein
LGDHTHAVIDQDAVLTLARLAGNRPEQARARQGLARARHELSYSRLAREHATGPCSCMQTSACLMPPNKRLPRGSVTCIFPCRMLVSELAGSPYRS